MRNPKRVGCETLQRSQSFPSSEEKLSLLTKQEPTLLGQTHCTLVHTDLEGLAYSLTSFNKPLSTFQPSSLVCHLASLGKHPLGVVPPLQPQPWGNWNRTAGGQDPSGLQGSSTKLQDKAVLKETKNSKFFQDLIPTLLLFKVQWRTWWRHTPLNPVIEDRGTQPGLHSS